MSIYEQLYKIQEKIPKIIKNAQGQVGNRKYNYADLTFLLEKVTPVLREGGLSISYQMYSRTDGNTLQCVLFNEKGETLPSDIFIPTQPDPQSTGIYITYYRRYLLANILNLSIDDDTDGDLGTGENSFTKKQETVAYPKPKWPYGTEMTEDMKKAYWPPTGNQKTFKQTYGCEPYKIGFKYYLAPPGTYDLYKNNPAIQAYTVDSLRALNYEGMTPEEKEKFDKENAF